MAARQRVWWLGVVMSVVLLGMPAQVKAQEPQMCGTCQCLDNANKWLCFTASTPFDSVVRPDCTRLCGSDRVSYAGYFSHASTVDPALCIDWIETQSEPKGLCVGAAGQCPTDCSDPACFGDPHCRAVAPLLGSSEIAGMSLLLLGIGMWGLARPLRQEGDRRRVEP
jgi:hypothetical protein